MHNTYTRVRDQSHKHSQDQSPKIHSQVKTPHRCTAHQTCAFIPDVRRDSTEHNHHHTRIDTFLSRRRTSHCVRVQPRAADLLAVDHRRFRRVAFLHLLPCIAELVSRQLVIQCDGPECFLPLFFLFLRIISWSRVGFSS